MLSLNSLKRFCEKLRVEMRHYRAHSTLTYTSDGPLKNSPRISVPVAGRIQRDIIRTESLTPFSRIPNMRKMISRAGSGLVAPLFSSNFSAKVQTFSRNVPSLYWFWGGTTRDRWLAILQWRVSLRILYAEPRQDQACSFGFVGARNFAGNFCCLLGNTAGEPYLIFPHGASLQKLSGEIKCITYLREMSCLSK